MTDGEDPDAAGARSRLSALIAVARNECEFGNVQINAIPDQAPAGSDEDRHAIERALDVVREAHHYVS